MSADNFVAIVYGKRHSDDDRERFLLFVVRDSPFSTWSARLHGGDPSPKAMLDYCLETWAESAKRWPTEDWYWWDIPAEDTLDAAWEAARKIVNEDRIEYGAAAFV